MINTIFYFCPTQAEYNAIIDTENGGEGISDKTITFVEDTREIYLNGKGYGKTSTAGLVSDEQFDEWEEAIQTRFGTIQGLINDTNDEIDQSIQEFRSFVAGLNTQIDEEISAQLDTADSYLNQALNNKMNLKIGEGLSAYQGFVSTSDVTWADLLLNYNNIKSAVNKVNYALDNDGNVRYTASLLSVIDRGIRSNTAFSEMLTRYTWLNTNQDLIEWMISGFRNNTGSSTNFAELFAAALSTGGSGSINQSALTELKAEILEDSDDRYVAKGTFSTLVESVLKTGVNVNSLSELALKTDVSEATTNLITSYNLDDVKTSWANLKSTANESWARIDAITQRNTNNAIIFNASFLDSAIAGILLDTNSQSRASILGMTTTDQSGVDIQTIVQNNMAGYATITDLNGAKNEIYGYMKDGSGNIISSSSLKTDVNAINSKLNAIANWNGWSSGQAVNYTSQWVLAADLEGAVADLIVSGSNDLQAAIEAKVSEGLSLVTITADNINFNNSTIGGFTISNNALTGTDGTGTLTLSPLSGILLSVGNLTAVRLDMDGSGSIANGHLLWNTTGRLSFVQGFEDDEFEVIYLANMGHVYSTSIRGTKIESPRFIKKGATNEDVLLGDGSTITIGEITDGLVDGSTLQDYIDDNLVFKSGSDIAGKLSFLAEDSNNIEYGRIYADLDGFQIAGRNNASIYINGHVQATSDVDIEGNLYTQNNAYIDSTCTASSFVKSGGSLSQILRADGSTTSVVMCFKQSDVVIPANLPIGTMYVVIPGTYQDGVVDLELNGSRIQISSPDRVYHGGTLELADDPSRFFIITATTLFVKVSSTGWAQIN